MNPLDDPISNSPALESFWSNYDHVLAYVRSLLADTSNSLIDAEDILQETFAAAWLRFEYFNGDEKQLQAWLKSIAKRKLIDRVRAVDAAKRGGREKHHVILAAGSSSAKSIDVAAKNRTPSSRIAAGEVASSVAACLSRLPDRDQTAIRMRYFDGHSLAEIGQTLGLTQQAVSMALKRAILRLRREMGGESQFF